MRLCCLVRFPLTPPFLELPFGEDSKRKILWDNSVRLYGLG